MRLADEWTSDNDRQEMNLFVNRFRSPRGWRRWALLASLGLLALLASGAGWLYSQLYGSLAQRDGAARLTGLSAPVAVERDVLGILAQRPSRQACDRSRLSPWRSSPPRRRLSHPANFWVIGWV